MFDFKNVRMDPCPFCGHEHMFVRFKQHNFVGYTPDGTDKLLKYKCYVVCKRCLSRGAPVITDPIPRSTVNPHNTIFEGKAPTNMEVIKNTEIMQPWAEKAIAEWNKREWV